MADEQKTYLINYESNLDKYIKEADEAAKKVAKLKAENLGLKASEEATGEQIEASNARLRVAQKEYTNAKKTVDTMTMANKAQKGSYEQLYQQWKVAQTQLKLMKNAYVTDEKGVRRLSQAYLDQKTKVEQMKRSLDEFGKGVADNRLNVGNYSEAIQNSIGNLNMLPGPLGRAAAGIRTLTTTAKAFIATPIGAIIAALAAAIGVLTSYFKRSEEGQNALLKVTKVLGSVLDNILDVVDKVGKAIFEAFTKPQEAVKKLGDAIKKNISNRIQAIKDIAGAIGKIFSKDWKQGFKELGESTVQLVTGVDNLFGKVRDGIKGFVKEVAQDVKDAAALADELAQIAKDERYYLVQNAKLAKESAALRAEGERLKYVDAAKSIELTEKAFDLDEQVLKAELEITKRKAANARESARLANSTKETLDEVARLEAEYEQKQAAFADKRRQRERMLNRFKLEAFRQDQERLKALLEIEKANTDAIIAENDKIAKNSLYTYDERINALKESQKLRTELLQKQAELELQEVDKELEYETISQENAEAKKLAIVKKYEAETLKVAATTADEEMKILDAQLKWENDRRVANAKLQLEIDEMNNTYKFDLQRKRLEQEYEQEIFAAEKTGADVSLINQKYAIARRQLDEQEQQAKLGLWASFAGNLATIFGENTAIGRAAAAVQTTIATYQAAIEAYKAMAGIPVVGPALGIAAAAAATIAGLRAVKEILSTKSNLPGDSAPAVSAPTAIPINAPRTTAGVAAYQETAYTQSQLNALPNQQPVLTAEDIAEAVSKLPPPVVTVEDINARTREVVTVQARATI